ncbi:MAG: acetylornithine deacetylase [Candidatus Paceibacteria bacterium]|jgi:acetylornithine deacetylase
MNLDVPALESLLAQLVSIPSLSGDEAAIAEYCSQWLEAHGLQVQRLDQTLLVRVPGASGPKLLLNTHYDTVPAGEGWDIDPWAARWEQDRLTGLGANDAKASVASMMMTMAGLVGGPALDGEVLLSLHQEEETNNRGMELVRAELGDVRMAVTGEPTGLQVIRSQSGLAVFEVTWIGKTCHAAHVSRVDNKNALLAAARELALWPTPYVLEGEHELLGPSTLSPTVMTSGSRHNAIPDSAVVVFDARLAPPHDADECVAILERALPTAKIHVRSRRLGPVDTAADHPLVLAALKASGQQVALGSNTLSDMALIPGTPAVKCGPGETKRSHTSGEYITRAELSAGAHFYTQMVQELLQPVPDPSQS